MCFSFINWSIYADLPSFPSPSLITGDTFRPDLILYNRHNNKIHILELTVGFESNLKINSDRKLNKYRPLITALSTSYQEINFINMSMSALGVLESSCDSLFNLLKSLDLPEIHQKRLVSKVMAIAIRSTYYIFCRRNKDWTDPDLMDFLVNILTQFISFIIFSLLLLFFLFLIQCEAANIITLPSFSEVYYCRLVISIKMNNV